MNWAKALALLMAAFASEVGPETSLDPKAEEVIARSRATDATYTIYWRVSVVGGASGSYHAWGATFRQGALLRVEDMRSRAVADCSTGTVTQYGLSIGRDDYSYGTKVAKRYCGIDADRKVISTRWLGRKDGNFGPVDEIQVVDKDGTSLYQVTESGVVVRVHTTSRESDVTVAVEPISFEFSVPNGDLFSRKSLGTSRVSKQLQSRGARSDR